ncbi:hypothetical protein BC834DRAFT_1025138 [Gloeopeniophorella convolvens]|nr:hypothetical protein BC834DRAFT_1025138 [Gloeopeniophorella convolvens]
MHDGTSLRQAWYNALNDAQSSFRRLLTSSSSPEWKRVPIPSESSSLNSKGKGRSSVPELSDQSEDTVYRIVLDVPTSDDTIPFDAWKSILATPELRKEWDPAVDGATLLEMLDPTTRISKTNFTLGWPANPRDAVTISRTFNDATTIIDVSTSLPRSPDEPAYLRPSPPHVRSNVKLFAWCIQSLPSTSPQQVSPEDPSARKTNSGRLRITCFWQHDLRAVWNFGTAGGLAQQLAAMVLGLFKTAVKRRSRVPLFTGYGNGVAVSRTRFDLNRESLTLEYSIIPEDEDHHSTHTSDNLQGLDELHAIREHRRLTRTVEFSIPISEGWDIQISTQASSDKVAQLPWSARAYRNNAVATSSMSNDSTDPDDLLYQVNHAALLDDHSLLKVQIVIERSASSGLRLNGLPQAIESIESRNPSSYLISQQMLQDATSTADLSFHTTSSTATGGSTVSGSSSSKGAAQPQLARPVTERTAAQDKSILGRVRRNYIYFSSLLQEPEAKWKRTTEARGVSVTQLDSIDPTLVVYKAEATFVGVGLWDLYAAIATPGARPYWDKQHEDAVLLEDVNELTELWHFKSRPTWPANARDAVLLKTVYKSPTTAHPKPNTIRTQVDLQGFAIEALSPTTTLLTLLEQSDPKGWTNKTSIPQQMVMTLAGIGEFAIKCGGPPVCTRLAGAKATETRYEHERGLFRIEYKVSSSRRNATSQDNSVALSQSEDGSSSTSTPLVECEIRCDIDTWGGSLDIVVDPPPQSVSCLRRHRLSSGGGGLWLTLTHDAVLAGEERLMAIVRRGPGRERGVVMLNGSKVSVDVEELPESEIKSLSKQKRVKPPRIPLDQPPVLGVIRRRRKEWSGEGDESGTEPPSPTKAGSPTESKNSTWASAVPKFRSPLGRYFMQAVEQAASSTQQAVAAISPPATVDSPTLSAPMPPLQYALNALQFLQTLHARPATTSDGWTLISEKGFPLHRKLAPEISASVPVYKGEKVIEGISAEELAAFVTSYDARRRWDERFVGAHVLETFAGAGGAHTAFTTSRASFPFRDRGFLLAALLARGQSSDGAPGADGNGSSSSRAPPPLFVVAASFPADAARTFTPSKYNPYALPVGRMFVDGWVLETLDPYTTEKYAIPSTRVTRVVAADYAGSLPAAVNAVMNTALVRTLLGVEAYARGVASLPFARLPAAGVLLADKRAEEERAAPAAWALRRRDETRTLVQTRWTPDDRVYRGMLLLTIPGAPTPPTSPPPPPPPLPPPPATTGAKPEPPAALPASTTPTPTASPIPGSPESGGSTMTVRPHSRSVSSVVSAAAPLRRRVASTAVAPAGAGRSPSGERALRATSSAFTVRGEVRQAADLLVAEVVVDSKLYPEGYHVRLRSRPHDARRAIALLPCGSGTEDVGAEEGARFLPLTYTVHTLPASPLHSSGLAVDHPPRHLLRLTLPTAQTQIATLLDPLTGETRAPPPKPAWLVELGERGAVVEVEIRPAVLSPAGAGKAGAPVVTVDDVPVAIEGEKESLTSLGREELQDDRGAWMAVLSRYTASEGEGDELPEELRSAVAVAEHLLEPRAEPEGAAAQEGVAQDASGAAQDGNEDASSTARHPPQSPATPKATAAPELAGSSSGGNGGGRGGGGGGGGGLLLSFLNGYPNPLLRFASGANGAATAGQVAAVSGSGAGEVGRGRARAGAFTLWTVIAVAVIAFLIGSLLRSLISPADFIYVVRDLAEVGDVSGGWREVRRLFEVKYIVGGWDFQVAVVRRH